MAPTERDHFLADIIRKAADSASIEVNKVENALPNLGVDPALALAMQMNRIWQAHIRANRPRPYLQQLRDMKARGII